MGESGTIPKEESKLEIVGAPFFDDNTGGGNRCLKKCPKCNTYYNWRFTYEFLIPTSENEITLTRLDDNEGERRAAEAFATIQAAEERFLDGAKPHIKALHARKKAFDIYSAADYLSTGRLRGFSVTFALEDAVRALNWLYVHAPDSSGIITIHVLLHDVPTDDPSTARKVLHLLQETAKRHEATQHLADSWQQELRKR